MTHRIRKTPLLAAALAWLILAPTAAATEAPPTPPPPASAQPAAAEPPPPPADSVSHHAIEGTGGRLAYTATAGTLPLFGPKGEIAARAFYTAYTLDGAQGRPVTFVFNGGPGAASAFLHLAAMGPRMIPFTRNGAAPAMPALLTDNPDTWLAFTDLVFVDPVGTGYSRTTTGGEEAERVFWGVEKDAAAMSEMIRLYLARTEHSLAPVFVTGESYGGFRAMLLADRLLGAGVQVKGALLISPVLDFSLLIGGKAANPLALALSLPSLAASWFETRDGAGASLEGLGEVETFARGPYLLHLAAGIRRDETVIAALARFTGLTPETLGRHHGRLSRKLFVSEYEKKHDRALSLYDGTVSAPVPRPAEDFPYDPILDGAVPVLSAAMAQYARAELGFRTDLPYVLLHGSASEVWDYGLKGGRQGFASAIDEFQDARVRRPALRIFIAHGYTDLVTPYETTRFAIDQTPPIDTATPVVFRLYRGGHMMYLRPESRHQLKEDARGLYADAMAAN